MTKSYSTTQKWLLCIGLFYFNGMTIAISPIMHKLIELYSDFSPTTVRLLVTVPSLIGCILPLFLANVVGKKIPYKTGLVFGSVLFLLGGVLPVVWNGHLYEVIFARFLLGVGFSFFSMRNAILTKILPSEEVSTWMGYGAAIMSFVAVAAQMISGKIGDIDWRYSFALYFTCLIPLACNLFVFREPERAAAEAVKGDENERFNLRVLLFAGFALVTVLAMFPIFSSISTFIAERGLGTAAQAGLAASACTLGQGLIAFGFGYLYRRFGRALPSIFCLLGVSGYAMILASPNVVVTMLGSLLAGAGCNTMTLLCSAWAGGVSGERYRSLSMTLIACAVSGGSFLSSYFMLLANAVGKLIPLFSTEIEKTFLFGVILQALMALLFALRDYRPKK